MVKLTLKIWIWIIFLVIALFAVSPNFRKGVVITSIEQNSSFYDSGVSVGEIITQINTFKITNMQDYSNFISTLKLDNQTFIVVTSGGTFTYSDLLLGITQDNLTIVSLSGSAKNSGLKLNTSLISINNYNIRDYLSFLQAKANLEPKITLDVTTNKKTYSIFATTDLGIIVKDVQRSKIKTGLDIQGGSRALVKPEQKLDANQMNDLISVSRYRLNVYGLSDVNIRESFDLQGNQYVLIEIAGATPSELRDLIAKQGKFEAKIGNQTVFVGGNKDITSVCRNDVSCAGIERCSDFPDGSGSACTFRFVVYLSEEAAKRHASITEKIPVNRSTEGNYLAQKLDLYLDDKLTDSLLISEDLKGKVTTQIQIQGSGTGKDQEEAFDNAMADMHQLQTVLITGSLPFKLEIVKLDSISPALGKEFIKNILTAALVAIGAVVIVLFIRYRKIKFVWPVMACMLSEIFITIGIAALIKWNLDQASIAGIIAAIGTGVDDQIVIMDEAQTSRHLGVVARIKRAFTIILGAYATVFVSLLPLFWAGAGLLKGFALTTIIGITVGVFVTRPGFGDIIKNMEK